MDDYPWLPGREEAVSEKIGNGSSQFLYLWLLGDAFEYSVPVGSTVESLQHPCSDTEFIFLPCIQSHSRKLMEARASQAPSIQVEDPALSQGPLSPELPPPELGMCSGWLGVSPPAQILRILRKCEYRFVLLLLFVSFVFLLSLSWLSGLGNKL